VYTVEACDVDQIVCEHSKQNEKEESWTFVLPIKSFDVAVEFPIGHGRQFLKLARSKITQFPINNDLATTGHKLQGMTTQYLIVVTVLRIKFMWFWVELLLLMVYFFYIPLKKIKIHNHQNY